MVFLDGDDVQLRDPETGAVSHRDIVQFVEYNKFKNSDELASMVLQEIPTQMDEFYQYAPFYADIIADDRSLKTPI